MPRDDTPPKFPFAISSFLAGGARPGKAGASSHPPVGPNHRVFVGPDLFHRVFDGVKREIRERHLRALLFTIDLTAVGAVGKDAADDEEALLDSMAQTLASLFRGRDLVARTGPLSFTVVVQPVPEDADDAVSRRLSGAIERLLRNWRRAGVVTCCAVAQSIIDERHGSAFDQVRPRDAHLGRPSPVIAGAQIVQLNDFAHRRGAQT